MSQRPSKIYKPTTRGLFEPEFGPIKLKFWCYFTALVYIVEESLQLYAVMTNYFGHEDEYLDKIDVPLTLVIRVPAIIVSLLLIIGVSRQNSSLLALFLYTVMEVFFVYLTYYSYKSITYRMDNLERFSMYFTTIIKAGLWWLVNMYHNYLKASIYGYEAAEISEI